MNPVHRSFAAVALIGLVLAGCGAPSSGSGSGTNSPSGQATSSPGVAASSPFDARTVSASATPTASYTVAPSQERVVVADGLDHPWSVVHLPDGSILFDQRADHSIYLLHPGTHEAPVAVGAVEEVAPVGEGGMTTLSTSRCSAGGRPGGRGRHAGPCAVAGVRP